MIIRRKNVVRQFVSLQIAKRNKIWQLPAHSERSDVSSRAVQVETEELLDFEIFQSRTYERFASLVSGMPVFEISYESMVLDLEEVIREVGEFLGAGSPDKTVPSRLRRQNPEPLQELILNFAELRTSLSVGGHPDLVERLDS